MIAPIPSLLRFCDRQFSRQCLHPYLFAVYYRSPSMPLWMLGLRSVIISLTKGVDYYQAIPWVPWGNHQPFWRDIHRPTSLFLLSVEGGVDTNSNTKCAGHA